MKGNTLLFLMRRRAISQVLIVAALLAAMGTDALAQAGVAVRAEAVVSVAERMAAKFGHAFARKVHQPAMRLQSSRPTAAVAQQCPPVGDQPPVPARLQHERLLYLPPPMPVLAAVSP